ncbi:MAG: 4Fe-4S binding protein [Coriobacteriia bacterium]|nr:4Fe-4S binding protein [Coriobacteriia bacterium]
MKKWYSIVRYGVLAGILVWVTWLFVMHTQGGNALPSVHAICPVGGLESFWSFLTAHSTIQKIFTGTIILFWFTLIFALFLNRSFCGSICPFGALQEFFGKLNRKNKLVIPQKVDVFLRYGKYVVLIFITYMAWKTASLFIAPYDPWTAYSHLASPERSQYLVGYIVLFVSLVGSILYDRFFCKYLCPAGAMYGLLGFLSPTKVRVSSTCVECGKCNKACPMNIDVYGVNKKESGGGLCDTPSSEGDRENIGASTDRVVERNVVTSPECIMCGKCVTVCPTKKSSVSVSFFKKSISPLLLVTAGVVIFFGVLFVMDATGVYKVSIPSVEQVQKSNEYITIDTLRGSMTIEEGASYTGFELNEFYSKMGISQDVPSDTQLKLISEYVPGYEFDAVKAALTGVKGK